jgi:DNA-binding NarL/FixJ family response regulator
MAAVIISESSIVAAALERSLIAEFAEVKRFARLAELDRVSDWTKVVVIYDMARPAEDIPAVLQTAPASAIGRMVVLTKETQDLRDFSPLIGNVGAIVPHSSDLEEIALIARLVRSGLFLLPTAMMSFLRAPGVGKIPNSLAGSNLTARERSILGLLAKGSSNKVIARALGIHDTTVRVHVRSVLRKIGVHNRTEAALYIMQHGDTE